MLKINDNLFINPAQAREIRLSDFEIAITWAAGQEVERKPSADRYRSRHKLKPGQRAEIERALRGAANDSLFG